MIPCRHSCRGRWAEEIWGEFSRSPLSSLKQIKVQVLLAAQADLLIHVLFVYRKKKGRSQAWHKRRFFVSRYRRIVYDYTHNARFINFQLWYARLSVLWSGSDYNTCSPLKNLGCVLLCLPAPGLWYLHIVHRMKIGDLFFLTLGAIVCIPRWGVSGRRKESEGRVHKEAEGVRDAWKDSCCDKSSTQLFFYVIIFLFFKIMHTKRFLCPSE